MGDKSLHSVWTSNQELCGNDSTGICPKYGGGSGRDVGDQCTGVVGINRESILEILSAKVLALGVARRS
ncbi:hypothetical protein WAI453_003654 [Rhynchosporium graminicola]